MSRKIILSLILVICLSITGCFNSEDKNKEVNKKEVEGIKNTEGLEVEGLIELTAEECEEVKTKVNNGKEIIELDLLKHKNRLLIPITEFRKLDDVKAEVNKGGKRNRVIISRKDLEIEILDNTNIFIIKKIDEEGNLVDREEKYCESSTLIYKNRMYIPLRFTSENLGFIVDWDEENNCVSIK